MEAGSEEEQMYVPYLGQPIVVRRPPVPVVPRSAVARRRFYPPYLAQYVAPSSLPSPTTAALPTWRNHGQIPPVAPVPMTVQQVLDAVGATAMLKGGTGSIRQSTYNQIQQAIQSGQLWWPANPACTAGQVPLGARLTQMGGKIALSFGGGGGATAAGAIPGAAALAPTAAIPIIGAIAVAGLAIFGAIFSHHAQAVAKERRIDCAAVPAANDALQAIEQAVASGQITPAQGMSALDQLFQDFNSTIRPILNESSSSCNAACGWRWQLGAISMYLKSQWNAAAQAAGASPLASAASILGSSSALPWLLLGGAALYLFAA